MNVLNVLPWAQSPAKACEAWEKTDVEGTNQTFLERREEEKLVLR